MSDALFTRVEALHAGRRWDRALDAGTGEASLRWLLGRAGEVTAVTGDPWERDYLRDTLGDALRPPQRVCVGNWLDDTLLQGERYDVVLADYLLGAVERFAPYFQDRLFARLRPHVTNRLYVLGQEPLPEAPEAPGARAATELFALWHAGYVLNHLRPYREYPRAWVERSLAASGYRVVHAQSLGIVYRERFIERRRDAIVGLARRLPPELGRSLADRARHVADLALEASRANNGIPLGEDYIVAAEPLVVSCNS